MNQNNYIIHNTSLPEVWFSQRRSSGRVPPELHIDDLINGVNKNTAVEVE